MPLPPLFIGAGWAGRDMSLMRGSGGGKEGGRGDFSPSNSHIDQSWWPPSSYGRHAPPPASTHTTISKQTMQLRMMVAGCDGRTANAERCWHHWRHIVNVLAGAGLFSFTALVIKLDETAHCGSSHHWRYRVRLGPSLDRRVLESALWRIFSNLTKVWLQSRLILS